MEDKLYCGGQIIISRADYIVGGQIIMSRRD